MLLLLLVLLASASVGARSAAAEEVEQSEPEPPAAPVEPRSGRDTPLPSARRSHALDYVVDQSKEAALGEALYATELWAMERNRAVYAWQDFSTKLIFAVVLVLVFTGIFFSGLQFFVGFRDKDKTSVSHNVEFSTSGIKVSSPFLGVVILVVSLAFFYLYLVHVYPISLTT